MIVLIEMDDSYMDLVHRIPRLGDIYVDGSALHHIKSDLVGSIRPLDLQLVLILDAVGGVIGRMTATALRAALGGSVVRPGHMLLALTFA